jgi:hypothetical protein
MVFDITGHPHRIARRQTTGNRLKATFNSTNVVVAIMIRAVTVSVVGESYWAVENATAWMANGNTINDKHAAFLCI